MRTAAPLLRERSLLLITGAAILLSALTASPASAQDAGPSGEDADQIVLTGRLVVSADETVDTAVILDGPALVEGTVREALVVFNGDTEIVGTVREDVVVFNGTVVVRSGAEIGGDLVTRGTPRVEEGATIRGERDSVVTRFDFEMSGFAGRIAWWVGYSISVLILGLLLLAFAPQLFAAVRDTARERLGSSIGWGVGLFFLLPIGSVLLLVTVVGIPLGIFTLLALAFIYTLGYVVATVAAGSMIMRSSPSRYVVFLVGWVVLRLVALIPFLGGWLWFIASVWGLGLLAVAIRHRPGTEAMVGPPPPVPPAPVPAV
jgi:tetrahydromethanopterin S-methyltransferase subunit G